MLVPVLGPVLMSSLRGEGEAIGEVATGRQRQAEHYDSGQAGKKRYGRCNAKQPPLRGPASTLIEQASLAAPHARTTSRDGSEYARDMAWTMPRCGRVPDPSA